MKHHSVLIYDLETDGVDSKTANLKFFGAYSYLHKKYYIYNYKEKAEIEQLMHEHSVLVGFNNKAFDNPIALRFLGKEEFKYRTIIDLFEVSAPKNKVEFGKNKLKQMFPKLDLKKHTLKAIMEVLKLTEVTKGDIDYKIFQKDEWTKEELTQIETYLKRDIELTKALFEFYDTQFAPLCELLPEKAQGKFKHITSSSASLSYQIVCHKADLPVVFKKIEEGAEKIPKKEFSGGHHILNKVNKIKGQIVSIDFLSAYPMSMIMGNLFTPKSNGWNGDGFFLLEGSYEDKEQGKIETALKEIMDLRLKAKKENDKIKANSYKIVINALYGLTGSDVFTTLYNPTTSADCTHIVRTMLKKLAKELNEDGFIPIYGFTDNIMVLIPEVLTKDDLMLRVNKFIKEIKSHFKFPVKEFGMDLEREMKFLWILKKNHYLWVDVNGKVEYKATLLNTNRPPATRMLFDIYVAPKIARDLDVDFTEEELLSEMKKIVEKDISFTAEEYDVKEPVAYKSKTGLQFQIASRYGSGRHRLIPNKKNLGVGRQKSTKNKIGVRYCTYEEFIQNNLNADDLDMTKVMKDFKKFILNPTIKKHIEKKKKENIKKNGIQQLQQQLQLQ